MAYIQVYALDESDSQHALMLCCQFLLGNAQGHVGVLGAGCRHSCSVSSSLEGLVEALKEYSPSVSLPIVNTL